MTQATDIDIQRAKALCSPHVNAILDELMAYREAEAKRPKFRADFRNLGKQVDPSFQGKDREMVIALLRRLAYLNARIKATGANRGFDIGEAGALRSLLEKVGAVKRPVGTGAAA